MKNSKDVVVITGASADVGRAAARIFALHGCKIGLIARGKDGLEAAKKDVESFGGEAVVLPADVADAGKIEESAEIVESKFGPIDIWINNAMTTVFTPLKKSKQKILNGLRKLHISALFTERCLH